MKRKQGTFVKSADTSVSVQESMEAIEHSEAGRSTPTDERLDVYQLMYEGPREGGGLPNKNDPEHKQRRIVQAERTAWRQLYLIIDATLTAHALGVMSISDAFLAHTMIVHDDGRSERMGDFVERTGGALAPGVRALLAAPAGGSD